MHPDEAAAPKALPRVLCVDDDENILDGLQRQLRKSFRVFTAASGDDGLRMLADAGPFPLVVSDYKMPGMNGIQFLSQVRAASPDSVRIMLTGQADTATAVSAVNQGNIFRFLVKPCLPMVLERVLEAGMEQHRLVTAERQLTEETLLGCVGVLVEVLSILKPEAFSRATRVRRYVRHIAQSLRLADAWQWEVAAMLSQLGWITLPQHVLDMAASGRPMPEEDRRVFKGHAASAARILEKVPRLDRVARIIEDHTVPFRDMPLGDDWKSAKPALLGAQVLRAAIDFDALRHDGKSHCRTLEILASRGGEYCPGILETLAALESTEASHRILSVPVAELAAGMIADEDICTDSGMVLLAKGQEITVTFAERLATFGYGIPAGHRFRVRLPGELG